MNTDPLKYYIKSREAYKAGREKEARELLAKSLDIDELTPILTTNIDKILGSEDPNPVIAQLIARQIMG